MLSYILGLKNDFIENHGDNVYSINEFIIELRAFRSSITNLRLDSNSYWKNYFHASFISAFQELTEVSLTNWTEYILNSEDIGQIFGLERANENKVLEFYVLHTINHVFSFDDNLQIVAVRSNDDKNPSYLTDDSNNPEFLTLEENHRIIDNLKVMMKLRGLPSKKIWGDNDVIVLLNNNGIKQQFCIISCKTSLRERVYQSIFWATHSRLEGIGKHVFVTTDKGASGTSEIGNRDGENNAKKSRDVLESTMDRVYVLRNSTEVPRSQVIKDFSFLNHDLNNWAKDIVGNWSIN